MDNFSTYIIVDAHKTEISSIVENVLSKRYALIEEGVLSDSEIMDVFKAASSSRGRGLGAVGNVKNAAAAVGKTVDKIAQEVQSSRIYQAIQSDTTASRHAISAANSTISDATAKLSSSISDKPGYDSVLTLINQFVNISQKNKSKLPFVAAIMAAASAVANETKSVETVSALLSSALNEIKNTKPTPVINKDRVEPELGDMNNMHESVIKEGPFDFVKKAVSSIKNVASDVKKSYDIGKGQLGIGGGRGEVSVDDLMSAWKTKYHSSQDAKDIIQLLRDFNFSRAETYRIFKSANVDPDEFYNENIIDIVDKLKELKIDKVALSWLERNYNNIKRSLPESTQIVETRLSDKDILDIFMKISQEDTNESTQFEEAIKYINESSNKAERIVRAYKMIEYVSNGVSDTITEYAARINSKISLNDGRVITEDTFNALSIILENTGLDWIDFLTIPTKKGEYYTFTPLLFTKEKL